MNVAMKINIQPWVLAIRPKTLPASISPVFIGTMLAWADGIEHWLTASLCLAGALCLQVATNLTNDFFDFKNGVDTNDRIGPMRLTQSGLIKPWVVLTVGILFFVLAGFIAYFLIQRGGWPIAVIAICAILCGIFYTAGPRPLGYLGLGDILVFFFFGPVAVASTYYVQSLEINAAVILASVGPGLISTAILTVNNLRDIEGDRKSGKLTLAVRFGRSFAQTEYLFCILTAALWPILVYAVIQDHLAILSSCVICFMAIPAFKTILTKSDGPTLNAILAYTGKILLVYSLLLSLGWLS